MKVGDLVRFKVQPDPARGVVVKIREHKEPGNYRFGVFWTGTGFDLMESRICWQIGDDLEVINENR